MGCAPQARAARIGGAFRPAKTWPKQGPNRLSYQTAVIQVIYLLKGRTHVSALRWGPLLDAPLQTMSGSYFAEPNLV